MQGLGQELGLVILAEGLAEGRQSPSCIFKEQVGPSEFCVGAAVLQAGEGRAGKSSELLQAGGEILPRVQGWEMRGRLPAGSSVHMARLWSLRAVCCAGSFLLAALGP